MQPECEADQEPDQAGAPSDSPEVPPSAPDSPDFLAELDRLWEFDVEGVEMAVRFRP